MSGEAQENYLKHIWMMSASGLPVTTSALAQRMSISAPSITAMIKKLAQSGLVRYAPYKPIQLTPAGTRAAAVVIRKHRIIEEFLHRILGMTWDTVHHEAERLEHAVSDAVIERIDALLGHPQHDVHGHPIPDAIGIVCTPDDEPLAEAPIGQPLWVSQVDDEDGDLLRYVEQKGLLPGVQLQVEQHEAFGGSIVCRVGSKCLTVGANAAAAIRVLSESVDSAALDNEKRGLKCSA